MNQEIASDERRCLLRSERFSPDFDLRSGPAPGRHESARRGPSLVSRAGGGADDAAYDLRRAAGAIVCAARSKHEANVRRTSAQVRENGSCPLRMRYQGLGIPVRGQSGTQTPSIQRVPDRLQFSHAAPPRPQWRLLSTPSGTHVPPSQQPLQSGEQSIVCPQLLVAVLPQFWLPQVVLRGSGVQPHTPGVPPPPQRTPVPLQVVHLPPAGPQAVSLVPAWQVPLPSQHPVQVRALHGALSGIWQLVSSQ
jgi:hypothetical protein